MNEHRTGLKLVLHLAIRNWGQFIETVSALMDRTECSAVLCHDLSPLTSSVVTFDLLKFVWVVMEDYPSSVDFYDEKFNFFWSLAVPS